MRISGRVLQHETEGLNAFIVQRVAGVPNWTSNAIMAVLVAGTVIVGALLMLLDSQVKPLTLALWLGWMALAVYGYGKAFKIMQRRIIAGWARRGEVIETDADFRFDHDGLEIDTAARAFRLRWAALSELTLRGEVWLFINAQTYVLPRRLFADAAEERAMLAFVLDHMTPDAVARSATAVAVRDGAGGAEA
jgi:hypothetical protein